MRRAFPPHTLAPPGGRLEVNENPVAGLHREIMEETGLTVRVLGVANVWFGSIDGVQPELLCINFVAEAAEDSVQLSAEHSEFVWAMRQQIESGEIQTLSPEGHGYRPEHTLQAFRLYDVLSGSS